MVVRGTVGVEFSWSLFLTGSRIQVSTGAAAQPLLELVGWPANFFLIQPDRNLIAVGFDPRAGPVGARVLFQTRIAAERTQNRQYDVSPTVA